MSGVDLPTALVGSALSVPLGVAVYHRGWAALAVVLFAPAGAVYGVGEGGGSS